MNDAHKPQTFAESLDPGALDVARSDAPSPRQGNITIVPPSEHRGGSSKSRKIIELHDDGRVTLNLPSYPRDRGALTSDSPEPSTSNAAETCSDPPPFPSLAPYKEVRPAAWSYLMLFIATQFYTMRLGNRDALSGLEAQAQLLRNIVTYIRDELRVHLPCFGDKTALQLQSILEHDPAFRDAMQRIVLNMDDDLAMRTIVHYLLSRPSPALHLPANPVASPTDLQAREYSAMPPFKPRLFKGLIEENSAQWTNLIFFSAKLCREIPTAVPTIEELGRLVHSLVSWIHADSSGLAPLFQDVTQAQFATLLASDPAFESAVRDVQTKASESDYFAYCKALRLLVNHLCQKRKGAQKPAQRVRISMPYVE